MSDCVWFSQLVLHDSLFRHYRSADPDGKSASERLAAMLNLQGDVVPPAYTPRTVRAQGARERKLGEVNLLVNRFLVVGAKMAAVLRESDMGKGALHPVVVQDHKGSVVSESDFFFWNIGNKFAHFLPEESIDVRKSNYGDEKPGEHLYSPPVIAAPDSLAFSRDCLAGPDAWIEMYLTKGIVLSDRLVRALKSVGLDKYFEPVRCRILDAEALSARRVLSIKRHSERDEVLR